MVRWVVGSISCGEPVEPFFIPVLHDWYNKDLGMCYPVYAKSSPCNGSNWFPLSLSLSECTSTICPMPFPSLKCVHISLWLNPTGHSKFHNTSNHPPPVTDSGRTAHTPLYPPVQAVPPPLFPPPFFFLSQTEEPAGTCVCDRCVLQQLALNVHIKHSDLT